MQLNFRQYSTQGAPLVILHGLFGSLGNWGQHSKELAEKFAVYGLDLRNHGASPHSDKMSYPLMAEDVLAFMDKNNIDSCHLIGHSMGGKVAMQLALDHPGRINRLIIVDIAPVSYPASAGGHDEIFAAMEAIDLGNLQSRVEADEIMKPYVDEPDIRRFLLTNLHRSSEGEFFWRLNLVAIKAHYDKLREGITSKRPFERAVLFVKGAMSNYIRKEDEQAILSLFPLASVKIVMNAGHWLHAEKPRAFQSIAMNFLIEAEE
ncbi:MAG: alpha/beta fold hydrolase [Gammaproteobacteria bacterium]|jgi:esterase|nr:alpha/beta hydrolase [Gammaproteobacteria bacterium]MDP6094870.1 alpha/beta fold hydrolase [Gammaproteobacteria bacterium]MDP7455646.1 alpha/beta fold hydrolase [Gammaproteobacteria bacterium]|tara:strand:+ start:1480 stop:2265 length:786 start_codon:yes stop_codon:yes gene_type:complete